ncbi:MAG TPA: NmrA/HSCARG family protein [Thermoanaerobaculia bacterium]|nr:NmrA/HSCARG family protein [Thermoanaerobaculia bacterium]
MTTKKTILVFGATGAQGGSVARNLLSRGQYAVRAFTRKSDSPAAQMLREAGAEIVEGDLDDKASIRKALDGVYGVFGVTNFWEHFAKEAEQGRNMIRAIAGSDVEHLVYSSLPPIAKATNGLLRSPHFDIKAEHEDLIKTLGIPATFVHVPFYYENFLYFFPPRPAGDGTYAFGFPQGERPLAAMSVQDVGRIVAPIFEQPGNYIGQVLKLAGDELRAADYAAAMARATSKDVRYSHVPRETFAALGFPGAEDLADMFEYYRLHIPSRVKDIATCRAIAPELQSFDTWVNANGAQLREIVR